MGSDTPPGAAPGEASGHNEPVATAQTIPASRLHGHHDRPSMVSVGTIIWLSSELMFFAALFASLLHDPVGEPRAVGAEHRAAQRPVRRGQHHGPGAVLADLPARRVRGRARPGRAAPARCSTSRGWGLREWFILTYVMGAIFIAGQATEYAALVQEDVTISSSAYGSMFYLTTGFHGLHVTGGLIAFLLVLGRTYVARRFTHEQAVSAIVVSYYWHFVDVVWIGLFATIYLIK